MLSFTEIQKLVNDKSVALVGNGHMMLDNNHGEEIDLYDIVIRCNKGFPKGKEKHLGTKTDILGITTPPAPDIILKEFAPKYIIWLCLGLGIKIPDSLESITYSLEYGVYYWPLCSRLRNNNPSTGIQLLELIGRHCKPSKMTLYGFDFGLTSSWYASDPLAKSAHDLGGKSPAIYEHEKQYAESMVKEFPVINIIEYDKDI